MATDRIQMIAEVPEIARLVFGCVDFMLLGRGGTEIEREEEEGTSPCIVNILRIRVSRYEIV